MLNQPKKAHKRVIGKINRFSVNGRNIRDLGKPKLLHSLPGQIAGIPLPPNDSVLLKTEIHLRVPPEAIKSLKEKLTAISEACTLIPGPDTGLIARSIPAKPGIPLDASDFAKKVSERMAQLEGAKVYTENPERRTVPIDIAKDIEERRKISFYPKTLTVQIPNDDPDTTAKGPALHFPDKAAEDRFLREVFAKAFIRAAETIGDRLKYNFKKNLERLGKAQQ